MKVALLVAARIEPIADRFHRGVLGLNRRTNSLQKWQASRIDHGDEGGLRSPQSPEALIEGIRILV